ncbi:MAG TPA: DUF1614 domain-containing protein [Candidatus Acidoferrales bacterium]|nr:DUF1614 domain-containing protein [Candidatus Acidoferrales bacterium]
MFYPGCLPALAFFFFVFLFPFFFANLLLAALSKLGLSPAAALLAFLGILFGGAINIPVKKIPREEIVIADPFAVFGFGRLFPRLLRTRRYTTIAINVGGCMIPCMLALYQIARIVQEGWYAAVVLLAVTALSIAVCFRIARPVQGIGIAMPALIPPLLAAVPSVLLMPDFAPPIAFVAGVLGPLIGADLLHLSEVKRLATGVASIGGAGTFDGIVLSGLFAAILA